MIYLTSDGPERTRAIAAALAPALEAGDVVLLDGDLGAGKTTFTQGLAEALGVTVAVTSPTFTLMRSYETKAGFDLLHVDVYRLESTREIVELGLPEEIEDRAAIAVIEWGERATAALQPDYLQIRFALGEREGERAVTLNGVGPTWPARLEQLMAALR